MCHKQELYLDRNKIGDVGVTALAKACAGGAMAQLQVSSLPTALFPGPETWHAHSPDLDVLYGVQYAGTYFRSQPDWRRRHDPVLGGMRRWGHGAVEGTLTPHCLIP